MQNMSKHTAVSTTMTGDVSWESLMYATAGFAVGACAAMCLVLAITACRRRRQQRRTVVHPRTEALLQPAEPNAFV